MKEALKLALEALESGVDTQMGRVAWTEYDSCLINEAITAIKEALAPPEQEVDWKDQYEKQKRRAEMWLAKYEEVAGAAPCAVPLAQPDYRAVKTYHEGKPVYVSQPEQEPVGYEHHEHRPFGAPGEIRIHAVLKSQFLHPDGSIGNDFQWLIDSYKADKNTIKLVPLYTTPPKRPWVGLTDEEIDTEHDKRFPPTIISSERAKVREFARAVEAKLKELNT